MSDTGDQMSNVNEEIANSPIPSKLAVKKRSSLFHQTIRFGVLNLKILKLSRQHH